MQSRSRKLGLMMLVGLAAAAISATALADDTAAAKPDKRGVVTVPGVVIKARAPRPLAAVDVARVSTQKAIPLRAFSAVDRIEGATRRAPF